jgi:hypothetical protein
MTFRGIALTYRYATRVRVTGEIVGADAMRYMLDYMALRILPA